MNYPFFRPPEVHAEAILLVGYRMYPFVRMELHPRLTLFAGGNGAGKTTLLDALQTILIADQRYLHLNVAAGQNDRDIGGQLQDRTAWAVLQVKGHPEVLSIGAHLSKRIAAEYVDVKPFALIGIAPEKELFLNHNTSRITPNLRSLNQEVVNRKASARVKEFASVNDYHRFLYEEGLLPIDLSRSGKRQFSLLWRQATQPHLGELNSFLQKTLCHEPEKKLSFDDVERLMQERLHTERQLRRLGELKALNAELQEKLIDLDHHRKRYLGIRLGCARQREHALAADIEQAGRKSQLLDEEVASLRDELDALREKLSEVENSRDKYVREQGDWNRKQKHFKEYVAHKKLMEDTKEEISWAVEELYPLETRLRGVRERIERVRSELQTSTNELSILRDKEGELEKRVRRWAEFQRDLDRVEKALGTSIRGASELEDAWLNLSEERRKIQELKPLRQLLSQWEARSKSHLTACQHAEKLIDMWPDFLGSEPLNRETLENAQIKLRELEKEIAIKKRELAGSKGPIKSLIDNLSKGRLPLPPSALSLVERGCAKPFIRNFDTLELEEAQKCQDMIGPLASAIQPLQPIHDHEHAMSSVDTVDQGSSTSCDQGKSEDVSPGSTTLLSELAYGKEPFFIVLSPDAWRNFRIMEETEHGTIAGLGDIAWYTPRGPVWIGAEARREQIRIAHEEIAGIDNQIMEMVNEEDLASRRIRAIQDFLPRLEAYMDLESAGKAQELSDWVQELERRSPKIEKLYPLLQKLFQQTELFQFVQAPEEIEALKSLIKEKVNQYSTFETTIRSLKLQESTCANEFNSHQAKLQSLRRDLDRINTICSRIEDEESLEVLEGRVDFGKAEEIRFRIKELEDEKEELHQKLLAGERKHGELRSRCRVQQEAIAQAKQEHERAKIDHQHAIAQWKAFYAEEECRYIDDAQPHELENSKASWDGLLRTLTTRLAELSEKYEIRLPNVEQPDLLIEHVLELLLPAGIQIDQVETQYLRLQNELRQIESKIKSHVEEVRSNVESEIRRLRIQLAKVNRILSSLHFGHIKRIFLELEELPAYQALKRLESLVRVITGGEIITLREFIDNIRSFIHRESNTTLSEEQIADYRSYIRIRRVILDSNDKIRESGLSSGETLGVNLALCLAVLFYIGREQGSINGGGMLILALDEAERLDGKALETIRTILDEVRCQLTVAMPRPINIPDSVCHLLTPLEQGVTHVHLYYRGGTGNDSFEPPDAHGNRI